MTATETPGALLSPGTTDAALSQGEGDSAASAGRCTATRHGSEDAYINARCRCADARDAHRVGRKRRKLHLIENGPELRPGVGTARRIRALATLGYGLGRLAAELDTERAIVGSLRRGDRPVTRRTEQKVRAVFDRLWDTPPSADTRWQRTAITKTRRYAADRGWLPPLAWDDDTIDDPAYRPTTADRQSKHEVDPVTVERLCAGYKVPTTVAERRAAVARLAGLSDRQTAERLGLTTRTVQRIRHDLADRDAVA